MRKLRRSSDVEPFWWCSSLAVPSWPDGLKILRTKAFDNCTRFENVILPEGLDLPAWFSSCGWNILYR